MFAFYFYSATHCCTFVVISYKYAMFLYKKNIFSLMFINQGHDSKSKCTINITEYVFITCPPWGLSFCTNGSVCKMFLIWLYL